MLVEFKLSLAQFQGKEDRKTTTLYLYGYGRKNEKILKGGKTHEAENISRSACRFAADGSHYRGCGKSQSEEGALPLM